MRIRETDMSEVVEQPDKSASAIGRFIVLIYGVISYIIGVVGLVAIVALASGVVMRHSSVRLELSTHTD